MRSWPLAAFDGAKESNRPSNPWNRTMFKNCMDCAQEATLWVEVPEPDQKKYYNAVVTYMKLCEPCYTFRVLGEHG